MSAWGESTYFPLELSGAWKFEHILGKGKKPLKWGRKQMRARGERERADLLGNKCLLPAFWDVAVFPGPLKDLTHLTSVIQQRALDVIHREPRMLPGEEKVKGIEETGGRCRKGPCWALPTLSLEMLGGWKEHMYCWVGYALQTFFPVAPSCPMLCDPVDCRPPCPSPTPRVYSNSCPLNQWCHPTFSFYVVPFSSHFLSFSASESLKRLI